MSKLFFVFILLFMTPFQLFAQNNGGEHSDPVASVILWVTLILFFGLIGRDIARKFNQPGVLGELLMGVLVGNIMYFCGSHLIVVLREGAAIFHIMGDMLEGMSLSAAVHSAIPNAFYAKQVVAALSSDQGTELIKVGYIVDIFSRYGIIFLLFAVGLESSVDELMHTGREAIKVALIGVIAPIILGYIVAYCLIDRGTISTDLFVAATLCATSIGITARVLKELKKLQTREAKTILGAAMLDDIPGLVILAVVSSVVIHGQVDVLSLLNIIASSIIFFVACLALGPWILKRSIRFFSRFLELWEAKLFIAFLFVMSLAWLATVVHLATIIGAFAAGLIIHDGYFEEEGKKTSAENSLKNLVSPLESILAPLFFVLIGIQVKLEAFWDWRVLLLAGGLITAAIIGKLLSGIGAHKKDDRLLIGIGMLPRGEVGLVFASIGRTLGVMSDQLFTSIVLMVIVTTVMAPPLLKLRFARHKK